MGVTNTFLAAACDAPKVIGLEPVWTVQAAVHQGALRRQGRTQRTWGQNKILLKCSVNNPQ